MALRNGLLIHGPTCWGAAARAADGSIDVASGRKPDFGGNRFAKVPLMRGPLRLAEAFAVIPIARFAVPSARLPFEDPKVVGAGLASTIAGNLIRGKGKPVTPLREGLAATVGFVPALVSLTGSDLAAYHAAEHKSIGGYEQERRSRRRAEGAPALRLEPDRADAVLLGRRTARPSTASSNRRAGSPARSAASPACRCRSRSSCTPSASPTRSSAAPSTLPATSIQARVRDP